MKQRQVTLNLIDYDLPPHKVQIKTSFNYNFNKLTEFH